MWDLETIWKFAIKKVLYITASQLSIPTLPYRHCSLQHFIISWTEWEPQEQLFWMIEKIKWGWSWSPSSEKISMNPSWSNSRATTSSLRILHWRRLEFSNASKLIHANTENVSKLLESTAYVKLFYIREFIRHRCSNIGQFYLKDLQK